MASLGMATMEMKLMFDTVPEKLSVLLEKLEKTLPLMEVDSIKFDSISLATSSSMIGVSSGLLTLQSYSLPLPKVLGSVDSALPKISASDQKVIDLLRSYNRYTQIAQEATITQPVIVGKDNPFPY